MDIDWNDEPEETTPTFEHGEQTPAPRQESEPTAEHATAAYEEREPAVAPSTPNARVAVDHRGFYMTYMSALAAVLLVVAIAGIGFVFGHYVMKPNSPLVQSPSYAKTSLPSSGSGGFEVPNFGGGSNGGASPSYGSQTPPSSTTNDPAAAKIATTVDPGLVDINTNITYQDASAAGTGMILTSGGLILTNNHVIEGSTSITARDVATGKTYTAKVVGYDLSKDIAVLQLENASGLTTVSLGNSSTVKADEQVVGIGNAGGVGGTPSYEAGTIVATDKSIKANSDENPNGSESLSGLIETNAPIAPGDSGGPLVTSSGKVVGMDTAALDTSGGFGFSQTTSAAQSYAIPINTALSIAKEIENGDASTTVHIGATAILGIEVAPANSGSSGSFTGAPTTGAPTATNGVTVGTVMANTPVASSGLVAGDVITSFDGHAISTTAQLSALEYSLKVGQSVTVDYVNSSGTQGTATFNLTAGPPQ
jgi:S1-C subfamily serine protease